MTMSPEERRRRMHKALERSGKARLEKSRGSGFDTEITDYSFNANEFHFENNIQTETEQDEPDIRINEEQKSEKSQRNIKRKPRRIRSAAPFDMRRLIKTGAAAVMVFVLAFAVKAMIGAPAEPTDGNGSLSPEEAVIAESRSEEAESSALVNDLERAKLMYAQYDYDAAEEMLKSLPDYESNTEAQELAAKCEETKATLVEQDIYKITHVFFHILCVDPENAFDGQTGRRIQQPYDDDLRV